MWFPIETVSKLFRGFDVTNREFLTNYLKSILEGLPLASSPRVRVRRDTWKNLYPNVWSRGFAMVYSGLHFLAPKIFHTVSYRDSVWHRFFPFRKEVVWDDLAEVSGTKWSIPFGNRGVMLVDYWIQPVKSLNYIKLQVKI